MDSHRQIEFVVKKGGPPPVQDQCSALIAAAKGVGFGWSCEKPYVHYLEKIDGAPVRHVTWTMDGRQVVDIDGEKVNFRTFRERFEDDAWINSHRDSTIARLRVATEGLQFLINGILSEPPHAMIRRGSAFALIPANAPPARRVELLNRLNGL